MPTWPKQSDVDTFYGRNVTSVGGVAKPSPKWESENLIKVPLPWAAVASWDSSIKIKSLLVHKKVEASLKIVLADIWNKCGKSQAKIEAIGMHLIGGAYNWRLMRGGNKLSMHSYGIAVDFDPANNGFGDSTPQMSQLVIDSFKAQDWVWGGDWTKKDGMHFQAARV